MTTLRLVESRSLRHPTSTTARTARVSALAALVLSAGTAQAQTCYWTLRTPTGPSNRSQHAVAFDSARNMLVLFGGQSAAGPLTDTWEWNGNTWTERVVTGPAQRSGSNMVFDAARGKCLLFGGKTSGFSYSDTWTWDGAAWHDITDQGPSGRAFACMAYDSTRQRVVLHGGEIGTTILTDTWEWDGATWHQRSAAGPARSQAPMAYDPARQRTVLPRGSDGLTWEWDGTSWSATGAAPVGSASDWRAAFDPIRQRVVLVSFVTQSGGNYTATSEWDGAAWSVRATGNPSSGGAVAWSTLDQRLLMVTGGQGPSLEMWYGDGAATAPQLNIQQHPQPVTVPSGQYAQLSVTATGAGPLTYQWYRDNVPVANGGPFSGAQSPTLSVAPASCDTLGSLRVVVSDQCGIRGSTPALLNVPGCINSCYANCDQSTIPPALNVNDFICFNGSYARGFPCQPTCYANCDLSTTPPVLSVLDFICFMNAFAAGCP